MPPADAERWAVVVFGSVGRGVAGPESDIDVLVITDWLPDGRVARVRDFADVERELEQDLAAASRAGWNARLSPVFKTPLEVEAGSPLFLDMVDDAILLWDREGFMRSALARFRDRLTALGARRIRRGNAWFWNLKPDYKPGEPSTRLTSPCDWPAPSFARPIGTGSTAPDGESCAHDDTPGDAAPSPGRGDPSAVCEAERNPSCVFAER